MQQRITRRTALALGALLPAAALSACSDEEAENPGNPASDESPSGTAGTDPEALHGVALSEEREKVGAHLSVRVAQQWRPEPREQGPIDGGPGLRILQPEDDDARPAPDLGYAVPGTSMGEATVRMPARADVVEVLDAHELTEDAWPELAETGDRLVLVTWIQEQARAEHYGPGEPELRHVLEIAVCRVPQDADPAAREAPQGGRAPVDLQQLVHPPGLPVETDDGVLIAWTRAFVTQDAAEELTGETGIDAVREVAGTDPVRQAQAMLASLRVHGMPGPRLTWDTDWHTQVS